MQTILKIFIFSNIIYISSCNKTNCEDLQLTFSSYDEATNAIRISSFKVEKSIISLKSSWINGAEYYSCDGIIGFFILKTNKQEYLYSGLPIDKWEEFANAESFGTYYNNNIKNKYLLKLQK